MQIHVVDDGQTVATIDVPSPDDLHHRLSREALGDKVVAEVMDHVGRKLSEVEATSGDDSLLTVKDIAIMCGVEQQTVHRWKQHDRPSTQSMPPPTKRIANRPLWKYDTIAAWAMGTERYVRDPREDGAEDEWKVEQERKAAERDVA